MALVGAILSENRGVSRPPPATITVREMPLQDLEFRIRYFHEASDEYLMTLGVDRALLPKLDAWRAFHEGLRTPAFGTRKLCTSMGPRPPSGGIQLVGPNRVRCSRIHASSHRGRAAPTTLSWHRVREEVCRHLLPGLRLGTPLFRA